MVLESLTIVLSGIILGFIFGSVSFIIIRVVNKKRKMKRKYSFGSYKEKIKIEQNASILHNHREEWAAEEFK